MTTYPLGKLHLDKQQTALQNTLRVAAVLAVILAITVLAFAGVNAAAPALAEMRVQSAVNVLNQDRLTVQRQQAMSELENAGEGAVPALIVALRSENPVLRRNAAEMLGYLASPQSLGALRDALVNDPMPQVRQNAAWALGETNNLAALNDLQQATVLDRNQAVRKAAAASIAYMRTRLASAAGMNARELSAFAAAPGNSLIAYLATRRDLVASSDGGRTWLTFANALPSLVTTLAVSPGDPKVLYASTDELGLFKSADGGITWTAINTGLGMMPGVRLAVTALAIDSTDPQRIFVTTGVWLGTSHVVFYPINVMGTVDGGATWQVYQETNNSHAITRLAIKGERLYALAGDRVLIY